MILDIIVILILAFGVFRGYKKGMTSILVGLIGTIIALVLAFSLSGVLSDYLVTNTTIDDTMEKTIIDGIKGNENSENKDDFYSKVSESMNVDEGVESTAKNISGFVLKTASFIGIFLIVSLISFILQMMLNLVFDLPVLSSINGLGGLVIGGILTVIKLWVLLAIISMLAPMFTGAEEFIRSSMVCRFFYDNNILVSFLSNGFKF